MTQLVESWIDRLPTPNSGDSSSTPALLILRIKLVMGQLVITQQFISHCPMPSARSANGSDVSLLVEKGKVTAQFPNNQAIKYII